MLSLDISAEERAELLAGLELPDAQLYELIFRIARRWREGLEPGLEVAGVHRLIHDFGEFLTDEQLQKLRAAAERVEQEPSSENLAALEQVIREIWPDSGPDSLGFPARLPRGPRPGHPGAPERW